MKLITPEYIFQNAELHRTRSDFGDRGDKWLDWVKPMLEQERAETVIDYGCGQAKLSQALPEYKWINYDPAFPAHAALPEPADCLVCTDVLEHIEPECLDDVLRHISGLYRKTALLVVACKKAVKNLPDGRNAHLIIKPPEWWHGKMLEYMAVPYFEIDQSRAGALAYVRPKAA